MSPNCGWCTRAPQGSCQTGGPTASSDGACVKAGGNWSWLSSDCAVPLVAPPVTPSPVAPPVTPSPVAPSPVSPLPPAVTDAEGRTGAAVCTDCPPGTYSTLANSSSSRTCTPCPPGTYSSNTSASSAAACIRCPAGSYPIVLDAFSSSTGIEVGVYSDSNGNRTLQSLVLNYGRCIQIGRAHV